MTDPTISTAHGAAPTTPRRINAADAADQFRAAAETAEFVTDAAIAAGTNADAIVELERRTSAEAIRAGRDAVRLLEGLLGVQDAPDAG